MKLKYYFFLLFISFGTWLYGQQECVLEMPKPDKLVNDFADILNAEEESRLEQKLVQFDRSTSTQITVVTVTDLCGYDQAEFTYTLGERWGVGKEGFDNGVVLMVKPTGGQGERHTFIATGYGLEAVIPDAIAKRIVEVEMIPAFRNNNFYTGLDKATDIVMQLASKEFTPQEYEAKTKKKVSFLPFAAILFFIILIFASRVHRARSYSMGHDVSFWTALWLLSNTRHRHGGGWGNFNSGSGNFGGSGGFGGFGGGSFGGGGAGGSW